MNNGETEPNVVSYGSMSSWDSRDSLNEDTTAGLGIVI